MCFIEHQIVLNSKLSMLAFERVSYLKLPYTIHQSAQPNHLCVELYIHNTYMS